MCRDIPILSGLLGSTHDQEDKCDREDCSRHCRSHTTKPVQSTSVLNGAPTLNTVSSMPCHTSWLIPSCPPAVTA